MSKGSHFVRVENALWRSDEWCELSPSARVVLIDIQSWFNGKNNGAIPYGLAHAIKCLRCSKSTAGRVLAELQRSGMIEVTTKGSFAQKDAARKGQVTTWRLTFLPSRKAPANAPAKPFNGATGGTVRCHS